MTWSAHLSMLFREFPYLERPRAAAEAGFAVVETWWPPGNLAERWAAEIRRLELDVACVNAYGGDLEVGERGFLNEPERRAEALAAFRGAVELAHAVGARNVNVLVGRHRPVGRREDQLALAADVLSELAAVAEDEELTIVVEPINELDIAGYLVPTPAAALGLVDEIGSPCIRLLYDAYHAARAGGDPCAEVVGLLPRINHVQFADCPGRGAPGTGELDVHAFARTLDEAGYTGAIGLEFDPGASTAVALGFLRA